MKLYHGSNVLIDVIDLTKSKRYKDFGQAFYLSSEEHQAQRMAMAKVIQFGGEESVTCFEFNEDAVVFEGLNVKCFVGYSREWAEFVFNNRDEKQEFTHPYDIVYGPIADDYIGLQIRDYKRKNITFEQFLENIRYHKGVTYQYAFCTERAVKHLIRL